MKHFSSGPFAGWSQLDEERTDCLVLRLPDRIGKALEPARLYAQTNYWRGATQTKKRHPFTKWANACLRTALRALPPTGVRFMHIGPSALARATSGELELSYLFRSIAPRPPPGPVSLPVIQGPAGVLQADESDE